MAILKLNSIENLKRPKILARSCAVYGSRLTSPAALVLARQHNDFNKIQRTTSFPEVSACCRRIMFSHFALEGETDDGETNPTVPYFNSKGYRAFKQECSTYLLSSQMVCYQLHLMQAICDYIIFIEPVYDRSGHTDGTTEVQHLPQDEEGVWPF